MAPATSSGVPNRPIGIWRRYCAAFVGSSVTPRVRSVAINPGPAALTVIPGAGNSTPAVRPIPRTPALDALYAARPVSIQNAFVDDVTTIRPPRPALRIARAAV